MNVLTLTPAEAAALLIVDTSRSEARR
jgi:hypothetical protein